MFLARWFRRRPTPAAPRHARLGVESLERREVPATLPPGFAESIRAFDAAVGQVRADFQRNEALLGRQEANRLAALQVTGIVDRRITNGNDNNYDRREVTGLLSGNPAGLRRLNELATQRRTGDIPFINWDLAGHNVGTNSAIRAEWAWNLGVGNSEETAALAYTILDRAGVSAELISHSGHSPPFAGSPGGIAGFGHDFVAVGRNFGSDVTDLRSWGDRAFLADPWRGVSEGASDSAASLWYNPSGPERLRSASVDNEVLYSRLLSLLNGERFASRTEEALAIREAYDRAALPVEVRLAPSTAAGALIEGTVTVSRGSLYRELERLNEAGRTQPEVYLTVSFFGAGGRRLPDLTGIIARVKFAPGEASKTLTLADLFFPFSPRYAPDPRLGPFTMTVKASAEFSSVSQTVGMTASAPLVVRPLARLPVTVVDDLTGRPLAGVQVTLAKLPLRSGVTSAPRLVTNAAGAALFPNIFTRERGSEIRYGVTARLSGYQAFFVARPIAEQGDRLTVRLVSLKADLQVSVFDAATRQALAGATVVAQGYSGTRLVGPTQRLAPGLSRLPAFIDGVPVTYSMRATRAGYLAQNRFVTLRVGATTAARFDLRRDPTLTSARVRVVDEDGRPINDVIVLLSGPGKPIIRNTTNGVTAFTGLPAGRYTATVSQFDDYSVVGESQKVVPPGGEVTFVLSRERNLIVSVRTTSSFLGMVTAQVLRDGVEVTRMVDFSTNTQLGSFVDIIFVNLRQRDGQGDPIRYSVMVTINDAPPRLIPGEFVLTARGNVVAFLGL